MEPDISAYDIVTSSNNNKANDLLLTRFGRSRAAAFCETEKQLLFTKLSSETCGVN